MSSSTSAVRLRAWIGTAKRFATNSRSFRSWRPHVCGVGHVDDEHPGVRRQRRSEGRFENRVRSHRSGGRRVRQGSGRRGRAAWRERCGQGCRCVQDDAFPASCFDDGRRSRGNVRNSERVRVREGSAALRHDADHRTAQRAEVYSKRRHRLRAGSHHREERRERRRARHHPGRRV